MAGFPVSGDQYRTIDRRMGDIKRQLCLRDGSPLNPQAVMDALQRIVEGSFDKTSKEAPQNSKNLEHIDCSARITSPPSFLHAGSVQEHQSHGPVLRDLSNVVLYRAKYQIEHPKRRPGRDLAKDLKLKKVEVVNANLLDYLFSHQNLIPSDWAQIPVICFWGTIYRYKDLECVRTLTRDASDGEWYEGCQFLTDDFTDIHYAVVFRRSVAL